MGHFLPAVEIVFQHEFARDPGSLGLIRVKGDKGGYTTRTGITFETFKVALGAGADLDLDGDVDIEDFRLFAHDRDRQIEVLRANYWIKPGFDRIRDFRVAAKALDIAVHAGPKASVILLQRAINMARPAFDYDLKVDGALGPKSLAALAACDPDLVLAALVSEQARFYLRIIERDPTQKKFKGGWLTRAQFIPQHNERKIA